MRDSLPPWNDPAVELSETDSTNAAGAVSVRSERLLLRLLGTSSLFALVFGAAPHSWMISIHSSLGMGPFPHQPVVWYLAQRDLDKAGFKHLRSSCL